MGVPGRKDLVTSGPQPGLRKDSGWELSHLINHTKIIIIILIIKSIGPRSVEFKLFIKEASGIAGHIKRPELAPPLNVGLHSLSLSPHYMGFAAFPITGETEINNP